MSNPRHYHFIGIGGYGMSALAQILLEMGEKVSGSDVKPSERTARLARLGATIHIGHDASYITGADRVVYSTDVPPDNPELAAARAQGLEVLHRSEVLAEILDSRRGIAVSGSHGKTTVTSMTAFLMERGGLDPTAAIGAEVDFYGSNAKLGSSRWMVAEADESDGSFVRYHPEVAVVTNIEPEHLERYGRDFGALVASFGRFLANIRPGGLAVLCSDDARVRELGARLGTEKCWYGLGPEAELTAGEIDVRRGETVFQVRRGGKALGRVSLTVPGLHNVQNALGALAVGLWLGLDFAAMAAALAEFRGARRRFQVVGQKEGIMIVDDYAHHPTEIMATLQAARQRAANRVIAVFQPQRYTRTHLLMNEFGQAFGQADEIVLTDIYSPPGEAPIPGVTSQALADLIRRHERRDVACISKKEDLVEHLLNIARPGDIILTMGAGDIWKVAESLAERLQAAHKAS